MTYQEIMDAVQDEMHAQGLTIMKASEKFGIDDATLRGWFKTQRGASLTYLIPLLDKIGLQLKVERK